MGSFAASAAGKLDIMSRYMYRNSRNHTLRKIRLETEFEDDGLTQKSLQFSVRDTGGFRMHVEAMTEYRWHGRRAYGMSEYVYRIDK